MSYARRLGRTLAAYQVGDLVSKPLALILLPVYTAELSPRDFGVAELLASGVILVSIVVRFGAIEAFVRFHFEQPDDAARDALARRAVGFLLASTSVVALAGLSFARPLSELALGFEDAGTFRVAVFGLWAFTNLELAYALLRVDERARTYAKASLANVGLTIVFTVVLVVILDQGARGLLLGNYAGSALVLLGLWWGYRRRLLEAVAPRATALGPLLRYGLPTVPAEASLFALTLVDRWWLYHRESVESAGLYSLAIRLAAVVAVFVRAFQYAWPPLAFSIESDREASRVYGAVTTWFTVGTGTVVAGLALLGPWWVDLLSAPEYAGAVRALPWVALGSALYGLVLVLMAAAGRAKVTTRNLPAAALALGVNVALLALLVPPYGLAGAGVALCGAYLVMILALHGLTRTAFPIAFEWRRLALAVAVIGGVAVAGELLLPDDGAVGFLARAAALCLIPLGLLASRSFDELRSARPRRLLAAVRGRAETESDPGAPR